MVVISKAKLAECGGNHAEAIDPLNEWWAKAKKSELVQLAGCKENIQLCRFCWQ